MSKKRTPSVVTEEHTHEDLPGNEPLFIAGVGASAGGLEAISELLSHLPSKPANLAIIVVQHLSPTYKSMLVQLLSKHTNWEVVEIKNGIPVKAGTVYITPPDSEISIEHQILYLSKPIVSVGPKPSIDSFFISLAEDCHQFAIGIILSGTGSDGAKGIKKIKALGGYTIVQDPQTAKYDGMPVASIETGQVDVVLPPDRIGEELLSFVQDPENLHRSTAVTVRLPEIKTDSLQQIFKLLSKKTGTDFSQYKPTTILRRLEKRLDMLKLSHIDDYLRYIELHPEEVETLFKMILIGVTSFFRDTEAFAELEKYLAKIISSKSSGESIRIWVPGCASGEEPYSIAILLAKILGSRLGTYNIQIFATDIDDRAIAYARRGIYTEQAMIHVEKTIIDAFFVREGNEYKLSKRIRSMVLFSKHDVTNNPPFVKLDLISCRNLLIYFSTALQKHVLPLFHYALNPNGYLFLGKSENIGQFSDLFATIDSRNKIFQRKNITSIHSLRFSPFTTRLKPVALAEVQDFPALSIKEMVKETIYNTFDYPYVVINSNMDILEIHGEVRPFLSLQQGTMAANIVKMAQPELQLDLRTHITRAIKERIPASAPIRKISFFNKDFLVRTIVKPLVHSRHQEELFMVIFEQQDPEKIASVVPEKLVNYDENQRIIELEQELTATKEQLQSFIEELETSNEELQSLNEELQSANEELQSGNEELETTNEELQSTNEEMQIAYAELRSAHEALESQERQLRESEKNMRALLNNSLQISLLIDKNYRVIAFNKLAAEMTKNTVGKELRTDAIVMDYFPPAELEEFQRNFTKALKGETVTGERHLFSPLQQRELWYRYQYSPVESDDGVTSVVSLSMLDISLERHAQKKQLHNENMITAVFATTDIGISIADAQGRFVTVNPGLCQMLGYETYELIGQHFTIIIPPEYRKEANERHRFCLEGNKISGEYKYLHRNGTLIDVFKNKSCITDADDKRFVMTLVRDITESKKYRNLLEQTQENTGVGGWEYDLLTQHYIWTEETYHIFGAAPSFVPTREAWFNYFESEARTFLAQVMDKAVEKGEAFDLELQTIPIQGARKWVRFTCKPIRLYQKTIRLFGTVQDITHDKQMEQQIKMLSLVASRVGAAVVITDAEGYTEWVNESFTRITGYTLEEAIGKKPGHLLQGPKTNPATIARIREALQKGEPFYEEILNYSKGKREYWLSLDITPVRNKKGEITNFIAIQHDVTERRHKEECVHLQMEYLQNILAQSNKFFAIFDKHSWHLLSCSSQTARFLGVEPEKKCAFAAIFVQDLTEADKASLLQPEAKLTVENQLQHNGTKVRLSFTNLPAPDTNTIFVLTEPL
ncbi:MAG: chemotaxis protein CheB [Cytophagales bacterium]|nr:PAS domain S-box protein [Bernardetiaceae bacterium]MDW8204254.1 chemotaxis protein CheB [Cytophagales bacterium]